MPVFVIAGTPHDFTPIREFRRAHSLPDSFGVALFEPKDYAGLGRIDSAGAALADLRAAVLNAVPVGLTPAAFAACIPALTGRFRTELERANAVIGLREVEIEFAAAGFADVCQAWAYARLRGAASPPEFGAVYHDWLLSTLRLSSTVHPFQHNDQGWKVQIVTHAYGRFGLIIRADSGLVGAVYDPALACPAEGFMHGLLSEIAAQP